MGVKVANSFLQWSAQPIAHQSTSPSQSLPSGGSSSSSLIRRRCRRRDGGASLSCRLVPHRLDRSAIFGTQRTAIQRSKSCEIRELSRTTLVNVRPIRRACSASLDSFSDEEFSQKLRELALKFQFSDDEEDVKNTMVHSEPEIIDGAMDNPDYHLVKVVHSSDYRLINGVDEANLSLDSVEPPWQEMAPSSSIERKASSVDLPLSLRIIKKKLQFEERLKEARDLAGCSMKKAFSSMVFMIRELQSFTLQMRELLFYEDLQGILSRVQKELHASFVWIFQQVFSQTPTLMVYVMILLANFTVYSMGANTALAASPPATTSATEFSFIFETHEHKKGEFDSSLIKTFSVSSSNGKTASSSGNNGGAGNTRPVAGGTDGKGFFDETNLFKTIVPDGGASHVSSSSPGSRTRTSDPSVAGREEEISLWNSMLEEAESMQLFTRDEALDQETKKRFASPVEVNIEEDDHTDYYKTELLYQMELAREPNNPLLLVNYAQFLYLVTHDYDRAEECFKRAIELEPWDAEAYNKYATFLWRVRNDIFTAEEIFLEAISADPTNSYYSANYAHFLWNTGGEDTCFPLSSPETPHEA